MSDKTYSKNDYLAIDISKENHALRQTLTRAQRILSHVEDQRMFISNLNGHSRSKQPEAYIPIDFSQESDPTLVAFEAAYEIIQASYKPLARYVGKLKNRIEQNEHLLEAYHNGEDILIAKLAMDGAV